MEMPSFEYRVRDEARNITYELLAYRPLCDAEVRAHVALFVRMNAKKIKKNSRCTIETSIGVRD